MLHFVIDGLGFDDLGAGGSQFGADAGFVGKLGGENHVLTGNGDARSCKLLAGLIQFRIGVVSDAILFGAGDGELGCPRGNA